MLGLSLSGLATPAPHLQSRLKTGFEGTFCFRPVSPQHPGIFIPGRGEEIFPCVFRKIFCFSCQIA